MTKVLRRRIEQLARQLPPSTREDTPELRRAWCIEHGIDPNSVLIGWETGHGIVVLPPLVDE